MSESSVDLAMVRADDALLDMLGGTGIASVDTSDAKLVQILLAWRSDVMTEPIPELVSIDAALAAINFGRK